MIVYSKQLTNRKNSATITTVEYTVQYRVGLDGSALLYCYTVYKHTFSHVRGEIMANSKGKNTVSAVEEIARPIAEDLGLDIWDIRYLKEGSQWYLRIFIDKDGGVDINDCERMSRALDEPLDKADPIDGEYILEVSSPGIERELLKPEHFSAFIGADIMVKMIRPIDGIGKEFKGVLTSYDDGEVTITDHSGENTVTVNKKDAAYIKLDDFD